MKRLTWRRPTYSEEEKAAILRGLLDLCKAGIFQGVWCVDDKIHVRWKGQLKGRPERMQWWQAAEMTGHRTHEDRPKKPLRFVPTLRPGTYGRERA